MPPELPEILPPTDPRAISMLTTEHFALQGLRSSTIADSSGRASLYLSAVSGTLVALSLLGNATHLGRPFVIAALLSGAVLIFLGFATFSRTLQSGIEDAFYAVGINRIRHLYLQVVPDYRAYFIQSDRDDIYGMLANMGAGRGGPWQMLLTTAGTLGTINSFFIGGLLAGLAVAVLGVAFPWAAGLGLGAFLLSVLLHFRHQQRAWFKFSREHPALFPSEDRPGEPSGG